MILFLFHYLAAHFGVKVPAVFSYFSTRMLLAAITALLLTILLGPRCIKKLYELKTGQSIRVEDCPMLAQMHEKKRDTPSMGGVLILFSLLCALILWMDLTSPFTLILAVTTVWAGLIGGIDDFLKIKYKNSKGLRGKRKFFLQVLLGGLIATYLLWPQAAQALHVGNWFKPPTALQEHSITYFLPFFKDSVFTLKGTYSLILGAFITIFVITGSSNAVNLTDGLDGLAAGCVMLCSLPLALVAFLSNHIELSKYLNILYIEGSGEIAVYLCAVMGGCLGFLWYNGYPAQVFMGDTGSLALGAILGVCAVLLRREFLFALAGGIFVVEALSVILQVGSYKLRNKKRIFLCSPLHHHFEYKGWPETKVVLRFWIIGLVLALFAVLSLKVQ